jgi:2-phosphinomethylmalic acid synthase
MGYYQEKIPNFLVLNEMVEFYASIGFPLPAKYPLFGDDAHRTRAGIHADGLNKNWRMYAPFDVQKLIGRNLEVSLTKDSGISGVQFVLRQHLGKELSKDHPIVEIAHKWIESEFEDGRMTSVEWEELDKKLNQIAPREYEIVKGLK